MPPPDDLGLLLVSQDAGRGRHQLLLVQLLRHLAAEGVPTALVLWEGGPLLGELRAACPDVEVVDELHAWWPARLLQRLGRHLAADRLKGLRLRRRLRRRRHEIVYVHGGRPARLVGYLDRTRPVVVHLHELEEVTDAEAVPAALAEVLGADAALVLGRADAAVVPEDHLVAPVAEATALPVERVQVQHEYGDVRMGRSALDLPEAATLLVAMGTSDWWRAPEQVVPLFWRLVERLPGHDLRLVWTCAEADAGADALWPLRHDLAAAGLEGRVQVVPTDAPLDLLVLADVVLCVGRAADVQDHVPELLVAGRPVVVSDDGDLGRALGARAEVVPYLDLDAAAGATERLLAAAERPGRGAGRSGAAELERTVRSLGGRGRRPPASSPSAAGT